MKRNKKRGKKALQGLILFLVIPILTGIFINWRVGLGFFGLVALTRFIKIKRRKYFARDTEGKEVGFKQFMKRWKVGIEGITPLQQAKTNLMGNWITLTGIVSGIVINALVRVSHQWVWIEIVLLGSLILVVIQMIGGLQKYWRFKTIDKAQKEMEESLEEVIIKQPKERIRKIKMVQLG